MFSVVTLSPLSPSLLNFIPFQINLNYTLRNDSNNSAFLLIGESGGGKSSFIECCNYMYKYRTFDFGVKTTTDDLIDHENENNGSPIKINEENKYFSSTKKPKGYFILDSNNQKINLIDTPGLIDTNIMNDKINLKSIVSEIRKYKNENISINKVIFIFNGSSSKLPNVFEYVLESFKIILSDQCDILFISTHCDDTTGIKKIGNYKLLCLNNPLYLKYKYDYYYDNFCVNPTTIALHKLNKFQHQIIENMDNFNLIHQELNTYSVGLDCETVLQNFDKFLELESKINNLNSIFKDLTRKYQCLVEYKNSGSENLIFLFEKYKHRFLNVCPNCDHWVVCKICFMKQNQRTDQKIINALSKSISINQNSFEQSCDHAETPNDIYYLIRDPHNKNLLELMRQISLKSFDENRYLIEIKNDIKRIKDKINPNLKNEINDLLIYIQTRTMITDFELFIKKKIEYLTQIKERITDINLKTIYNDQIELYRLTIGLLFEDALEELMYKLIIII